MLPEHSISKKTSDLGLEQEPGRPSLIRMRWTPVSDEYPNALKSGLHTSHGPFWNIQGPMGRQGYTDWNGSL